MSEISESFAASDPWYRRIGPGLITACVVIGPGSIMTSSKVGANEGYAMLWVVLLAAGFMTVYMTLGAKLGVATKETPATLIRRKAGKGLAISVGASVFFISAAFQSGNNIGVAAACEALGISPTAVIVAVLLLNALAIGFLWCFQDFYRHLERLMAGLVAIMLVCFLVNLLATGVDPQRLSRGLVPSLGRSGRAIDLLGLIGTTFVVTAGFYQAYLVRQKGWSDKDARQSLVDARIGAVVMCVITMLLMCTAASGLYTGHAVELSDPVAVARALESTFGPAAKIIFSIGLFSAAYSSFLINAMVGGFVAADGCGFRCHPGDPAPRWLTTASLLTGAGVSLAVLIGDFDRTPTIIAAQAVTVVVSPLVAGVLWWLTSSKEVMGTKRNGLAMTVLAAAGWLILVAIAGNTALHVLPAKINRYRQSEQTNVDPGPNDLTTELVAKSTHSMVDGPCHRIGLGDFSGQRYAMGSPWERRPADMTPRIRF